MSDPVSNSEVEDVLSSIRRLVSEDRHPINRNRLDVPKDDKLVLTPSFRVASDTPAADSFRSQRKPMQPSGAMGGGTSRDTADFAFPLSIRPHGFRSLKNLKMWTLLRTSSTRALKILPLIQSVQISRKRKPNISSPIFLLSVFRHARREFWILEHQNWSKISPRRRIA